MDVATVGAVVAASVFCWGVVSARLERADLTAPIVFMAVGAVLAGTGAVDAPSAPELVRPLVEVTLVWVLFSDAARLRVPDLRADLGMCTRLLAVGLPLTVLAGWALARGSSRRWTRGSRCWWPPPSRRPMPRWGSRW